MIKTPYATAHQLQRYHHGKASDYKCVHCGKQAQEWATVGLKQYQPMCIRCHRRMDKSPRCGEWMPYAKEFCSRPKGHKTGHRSITAWIALIKRSSAKRKQYPTQLGKDYRTRREVVNT